MKMFYIFLVMFLVMPGFVKATDDVLVAKIGDRKIMMSDFNRIISYQDADKQMALEQTPAFKATVLSRLVQSAAISSIARDKGFDKRADIKEQLDIIIEDFLATQYITHEVVNKIIVTEDDLKLYYKTHLNEFMLPEMINTRHILIRVGKAASADEKQKAKQKAEGILNKIKAGEDFVKVATEASEDNATKSKGGSLGLLPKGKMPIEYEKAAFSLKSGEMSDVVETPFGFHIIKVDERVEAKPEPFDKLNADIKAKIKVTILNEFKRPRIEEFVTKAMKDAGVEVNIELFLPKN